MEKILIVDDNPTDRFVQQKMLESKYSVRVAETPFEAEDIIKEWQPDVIVIDYAMPDMNGIQAIQHFKEKLNYDSIYLILTGLDDINIATEAIRQGAYDYLVKPLISTIFNNKIKNCMDYKKLLKAAKEKVATAAIERIILSIYYELKPIYDNISKIIETLKVDKKDKGFSELMRNLEELSVYINKLGNLDEESKKEFVENILVHYLK